MFFFSRSSLEYPLITTKCMLSELFVQHYHDKLDIKYTLASIYV